MSKFCAQCGAALESGRSHCESCGQPVPETSLPKSAERPKTTGRKGAGAAAGQPDAPEPEEPPLEWERRVPVLTNQFMLWDYVKVLFIALLALEAIGTLTTFLVDGEASFLPPQVLLIPIGVLAALYVLVTGLILGNRFEMRFKLGPNQVLVESRPSATSSKIIRVLAFIPLFMRGRFLAAAEAGSSEQGESSGTSWAEIERVRAFRRQRVIELRNSWRTVVRLYCTPEVFDLALARSQAHAEQGAIRREKRIAARPRPAWGFWAAWLVLAVVATFGSGGWYWAAELRDRFALLTGVLVLLAGLFRETVAVLLGLGGFISGLVLLGTLIVPALERDVDAWLGTSYGFQLDTGFFVVSLAGTLLLLGMGLYRVLGRGPGGHSGRREPKKKRPARVTPAA